jgi:hypothetical protein
LLKNKFVVGPRNKNVQNLCAKLIQTLVRIIMDIRGKRRGSGGHPSIAS